MEMPSPPILAYAKRPKRRMPPWLTASLMLAPIAVPLYLLGPGPVLYTLSGQHFTLGQFDTDHAGSVLDQPTIGKWLLISTFLMAVTIPPTVIIGLLSGRTTRSERLAFAIPASVLGLILACVLTIPAWWLVQYVHSMGFTERRVWGLLYSAGLYVVIAAMVCLAWLRRLPLRAAREREEC